MRPSRLNRACRIVLFAAVLLTALGPARPDRTKPPIPDISRRINAFTVDLMKAWARGETLPANAVLSPQSLFHGLAMSYIASGGRTRGELAAAFHFPDDNEALLDALGQLRRHFRTAARHERVEVTVAQSLWLDDTYADFRDDYVDQVRRAFDASVHRVAFADRVSTSDAINAWVSQATRGRITRVVSPDDFLSRSTPGIVNEPALVAVNALYFNADWASRFDAGGTRSRPFHLNASETATAMMMHQHTVLAYAESETLQFLELPYIDNGFSMYVLLPKAITGTGPLLDDLTAEAIFALKRRAAPREVDVLLPRFEMRSRLGAKDVLRAMGVRLAFHPVNADFDRMIHKTLEAFVVYISEIYHDAWIDVHEDGTEAAAATTTVHYSFGCCASPPPDPVAFHADHPFLFFVVHNDSRSILLAGWLSDPDGVARR